MQVIEKISNKNYRIDLTTRQITFLDSRFYYSELGNHVPSVTTILEAYPKGAAYYEWLKKNGEDSDNIRDEAGRRGSVVHDLTEQYDNGVEVNLIDEHGNISVKMSEWAMFERYVQFRKRTDWKIIHSELNIVSESLGFGGTLDRVFDTGDRLLLVDIKTSNAIYPHYFLQLAAYKKLLAGEGIHIEYVAILWLNAKTRTEGKAGGPIQGPGWQLIMGEEEEKSLELFEATKLLWLAENENMKPKQLSYSLSHQK